MKILILFFILFSNPVFAKKSVVDIEQVETQTQDGAILKGIHVSNPRGQKILLVHGFSENYFVFESLIQKLYLEGYDVYAFNLRGHGNDEERSLIPKIKSTAETENGSYGFDKIVTQDIPAMIDFVYDGKPIVVLGHSLGGSAIRFFLNGIRDYGDGLYQTKDPRKLNKYLDKVKSIVNVGSPTSFQISDFRFKIWTKLPESLTNFAMNPLMRKYLGEYIFSGLLEKENIDNPDRLYEKAFSVIAPDLIQDVQRWSKVGFISRNGTSYQGQEIIAPHFLQVVGSKDALVPVEEVMKEHEENHLSDKAKVVVMKGFGHIDLVYGQKSSNILEPIVKEFSKKGNLSFKIPRVKVIDFDKKLICEKLF